MGRRSLILLGILLIAGSLLQGQHYFFKQFSVSEGLAQSTVYAIYQDRNDIYWLGTQAGISSFDGQEFLNYPAGEGIAANGVRAICEDKHGQLWFGHTGGGLTRYAAGAFQQVEIADSLLTSTITSMTLDKIGSLWITSEASGVICLENPLQSAAPIQAVQYAGSEISDRVYGSFLDLKGGLYFVTDLNVKRFNADSLRFDNVVSEGVPLFYNTTSFLVDHQGMSWTGKYNGGLYRYDSVSGETKMFDLIEAGLSSNWVSTLSEDSRGRIWAGTWGGGLACIDQEGEIRCYTSANGLPGMKIRTVREDVEGNILIGTQGTGSVCISGGAFCELV